MSALALPLLSFRGCSLLLALPGGGFWVQTLVHSCPAHNQGALVPLPRSCHPLPHMGEGEGPSQLLLRTFSPHLPKPAGCLPAHSLLRPCSSRPAILHCLRLCWGLWLAHSHLQLLGGCCFDRGLAGLPVLSSLARQDTAWAGPALESMAAVRLHWGGGRREGFPSCQAHAAQVAAEAGCRSQLPPCPLRAT